MSHIGLGQGLYTRGDKRVTDSRRSTCSPRGSITTTQGFHCVSRANPFLGGGVVRISQETDAAFIIQVSHILHLWSEPLGSLEYTLGNPSPEVLGSCHFIHTEKTCL